MANEKKEDNLFVEKTTIKKVQIVKPCEIANTGKKPIFVRTERLFDHTITKWNFLELGSDLLHYLCKLLFLQKY